MELEMVLLNGDVDGALFVHPLELCLSSRDMPCCIHAPSDHAMRGWRQFWNEAYQIMMRQCPHGEVRPDPDDLKSQQFRGTTMTVTAALATGIPACCAQG